MVRLDIECFMQEQVSSVDIEVRMQLAATVDFIREGDTLVVTRLDRLARSVSHLMQILDDLAAKSEHLRILGLGIDTAGPTGKLILTVLGGMAEFERGIMLERQREGIAKAKAAGKYKGRKPTVRAKSKEVMSLHNGGAGASEIARQLGIGRASVYCILNSEQTVEPS